MVTTNPAKTLRWDSQVGSVEAGKVADLTLVTAPTGSPTGGLPASPYRSLIDATDQDVRLVMVGGDPLAGDAKLMKRLKPGDSETVTSECGGFTKALDVTKVGVPLGDETFAAIRSVLEKGLAALGGDHPSKAGGVSDPSNTYSELKASFEGTATLSDADFRSQILEPSFGTVNGSVNLEQVELAPLFDSDDHFLAHVLAREVNKRSKAVIDPAPPYKVYPAILPPALAAIGKHPALTCRN
jgi:hypothetical protein